MANGFLYSGAGRSLAEGVGRFGRALQRLGELSPAERETLAALEEAMIHTMQEDGR